MLAFQTTSLNRRRRFRYCALPVDDFTWAIHNARIALNALFCINAEL
jgi:hypothetical protein